ncbi:hypothetical protein OPT61_g671 [Boeremia exigua]|uniref:Uncharacterized protein n=1 Tax=Boeremia exigua TaxID=749465 RepID=A0ACC2IT20_9PLEO|nr:hypothetical protein OPT61_g671 [Boeremia exigua]
MPILILLSSQTNLIVCSTSELYQYKHKIFATITQAILNITIKRVVAPRPYSPKDKMTILTKLEAARKQAGELTLDFSKSQMSPTNASCLQNILRKQKKHVVVLQTRKCRRKPSIGEARGTDSNAISRVGRYAGANYSPRNIKTTGWVLEENDCGSCDPGPREGTLRRRSVPRPEERMYFPNIIRNDKAEQTQLELRRNREKAVQLMKVAQEVYRVLKQNADADKEKVQASMESMERVNRKHKVKQMVEEVIPQGKPMATDEENNLVVLLKNWH